ncbi:hypothetical protein SODALDRAFT_360647 [Sodiomyces alkalinus F11]|uniref:Uncharacterized protein n=1 Tax=Sodiomyces alkalinus (strain CBS 110278 / VKM F-3762 / F11) TaxID=1314773 RepID=A0A3N2PUW5_SODAK|nr:hypothetical protein SODALDRAFT_360647 [Sodiomyces alkalinus F11]ROT38293.1 hypothetical protein SODALDRAFT_360647 [Sodiomyces alkalinus F11]
MSPTNDPSTHSVARPPLPSNVKLLCIQNRNTITTIALPTASISHAHEAPTAPICLSYRYIIRTSIQFNTSTSLQKYASDPSPQKNPEGSAFQDPNSAGSPWKGRTKRKDYLVRLFQCNSMAQHKPGSTRFDMARMADPISPSSAMHVASRKTMPRNPNYTRPHGGPYETAHHNRIARCPDTSYPLLRKEKIHRRFVKANRSAPQYLERPTGILLRPLLPRRNCVQFNECREPKMKQWGGTCSSCGEGSFHTFGPFALLLVETHFGDFCSSDGHANYEYPR